MNTVLESTSKPNKDTETSMKVPSTASKISYVNKSMEIPVSVIVSSKTNTMVEGSISSEISNGSSSKSIVNKPTLVSSSIDIPVRSWSNLIKDESSAVSTNSPSGIPNKESSDATSIKSSVQASIATTQNTAVINNTNKSQYKPRWSSGCGK